MKTHQKGVMAGDVDQIVSMLKNVKNIRNLEPVKTHKGFCLLGVDHNVPVCHWYKGIALPTIVQMGLDTMENMKFDPKDIFLCGQMKTGTTWIGEIMYHLNTEGKDFFNPNLPGILERIPTVSDPAVGAKIISTTPPPHLIRSHLSYFALPASYREVKPKTVYLMRNPRDTCVAAYHYNLLNKVLPFKGSFDDFFEAFIEGDVPFGPFTRSVGSFWENKDKLNILFVCYEDLYKDFTKEVERIAKFLNVSTDKAFLDNLRKVKTLEFMRDNPSINYSELKGTGVLDMSKDDWFMRKGVVGDWKNYFTEEQVKRMDRWIDNELGPLGVQFCYELGSQA